jgi:hypothetical protein
VVSDENKNKVCNVKRIIYLNPKEERYVSIQLGLKRFLSTLFFIEKCPVI